MGDTPVVSGREFASISNSENAKCSLKGANMGSPAFHPHEIIWTPELIGRFWDYFVSNPNLEWNYFN